MSTGAEAGTCQLRMVMGHKAVPKRHGLIRYVRRMTEEPLSVHLRGITLCEQKISAGRSRRLYSSFQPVMYAAGR